MSEQSRKNLECEEIFAQLSDYLNDEVPADVADCISAHIADCGPCVEFVASLRKSVALCKQYRAEEMPSALAEDIRDQLRRSYERLIELRRRIE